MALNKKVRFEIFKRDVFTCQYCGRRPPEAVLQIDHIIPVSKGGTDEDVNLITSCRDCNLGKSNRKIDNRECRPDVASMNEELREQGEQLEAYYKYRGQQVRAQLKKLEELNQYWSALHGGKYEISTKGMLSIKWFLSKLTVFDVIDAMDIAVSKEQINGPNNEFRYMCGILHNWIKNGRK